MGGTCRERNALGPARRQPELPVPRLIVTARNQGTSLTLTSPAVRRAGDGPQCCPQDHQDDCCMAVVHDREQVFVTSANLTPNALDRNIDAGVLVRDRSLARTLAAHFQRLIDTGLVMPLPPVE
ncbi:MAG: hypothetical protein EBT09_08185 [Actinobacteria bacterium]|nr:hypothetical protein [Actinomycetota bacterium]